MPRSQRTPTAENEELQRQLEASQRECEELRARVAEHDELQHKFAASQRECEELRARDQESQREIAQLRAMNEAASAAAAHLALMPPQPAVEHAQPQLQGRQRQRNDEVLDDRPGKRARKALEGEKFREKLVDEIPPTGLALAQLGRDQFPTDIIQDGNQIQEVLARDGPMRRFRVGLFRDGKPIKGEEINGANGLSLRVELRYAGRTIPAADWLHAHDPEHNRNGKQVSDVATFRDHEVAIPISIKALSSDSKLFPGASKQHHVPLTLAVVVDAAAHGGETFGVAEALTRPFISKAKADSARKRIDGAPRAAHADGAFRNFTGTADLTGTAVVGGPPVQPVGDIPIVTAEGAPQLQAGPLSRWNTGDSLSALFNDDAFLPSAAPSRANSGAVQSVMEEAMNALAAPGPSRGITGDILRSFGAEGRAELADALAAEITQKLSPENSSQEAAAAEASAAPDPTTRNDGKRRGARRSGRGAAA